MILFVCDCSSGFSHRYRCLTVDDLGTWVDEQVSRAQDHAYLTSDPSPSWFLSGGTTHVPTYITTDQWGVECLTDSDFPPPKLPSPPPKLEPESRHNEGHILHSHRCYRSAVPGFGVCASGAFSNWTHWFCCSSRVGHVFLPLVKYSHSITRLLEQPVVLEVPPPASLH